MTRAITAGGYGEAGRTIHARLSVIDMGLSTSVNLRMLPKSTPPLPNEP
jgi:hypothetical protein